jgi:hypothetical protein
MDLVTAADSRPKDHALVQTLLQPVMTKKPRSQRGDGRIFQRGPKWWIAYYVRREGRSIEIRESAGNTESNARKLLKRRQDELCADRIGARRFQGPQQERVTVLQLLDALKRDYELRGLASLVQLRAHQAHHPVLWKRSCIRGHATPCPCLHGTAAAGRCRQCDH